MKWTWTSDRDFWLEFPTEIGAAYVNFRDSTLPSERIACAKIVQQLLLQQVVDIFYLFEEHKSFHGVSKTLDVPQFAARMVDIQRLNLYLWDNDPERYESERFGNRLSEIFKRPLGEYALDEFIQNVSQGSKYRVAKLVGLVGLLDPMTPDICVQKANEACQILVQRMSNPYIGYSMSPGLPAIENFHNLYYDTRRALLLLMKVTKAEPEPLAFLDDCRKIKLKFLPLNDLWILSHSGGSKGVHVELTVKPIVSAPGRVAINFVTLFVKPTGPDLELITELKLSFAPFTVHPQSIVLVEAEVGSPNDLYDISMTKGVTRSATTNLSATAAPVGSFTASTSTAITIKATTQDWTHSQLKSRDRFYPLGDTFVTERLTDESNNYSGTYFWKLERVAGKTLDEYLKPKSRWNFPSIPKHGKSAVLRLPWNEDYSINFTCGEYPKSFIWHFNNQDRKETMKWVVKLEITVVGMNKKTRRFIMWSDPLESIPPTINEEGSTSNNVPPRIQPDLSDPVSGSMGKLKIA